MQSTANIDTFRTAWAIVVDTVRGGLGKDAFTGAEIGRGHRSIPAGAVVVTGSAGRDGDRIHMHVAAAAPDGTPAPVRVATMGGETPVDFLDKVERYLRVDDPRIRVQMAVDECGTPYPDRLADIERDMKVFDSHASGRRKGPAPACRRAPSWAAARREQRALRRRRDAREVLRHTLCLMLDDSDNKERYRLHRKLRETAEKNAAGELTTDTRDMMVEMLKSARAFDKPIGMQDTDPYGNPLRKHHYYGYGTPDPAAPAHAPHAPAPEAAVQGPAHHPGHPQTRMRHPTAAWAKVLSAIEPHNGRGGYAFEGKWLRKGAQNDVPLGSILLTAHDVGSRRHPRRERMASLVCIDADDHAVRIPIATDANRSDLDFRDHVAAYLAAPPIDRVGRLGDALYAGEPGPRSALAGIEEHDTLMRSQYLEALEATSRALAEACAADPAEGGLAIEAAR